MKNAASRLAALTRTRKRAVMIAFDAVAMLVSLWLAFCIRLGDFYIPANEWIVPLAFAAAAGGVVALLFVGTYRVVIRYLDLNSAVRLATGAAAASAVWFFFAYISRVPGLPRSVGFIYFGLLFLTMFFGRLSAFHVLSGKPLQSGPVLRLDQSPKNGTGVAIHGANSSGSSLAQSLRRHPRYRLRCFVDDSPALVGRTMQGVPIRSSAQLREEVRSGLVEQVFLAQPSASRSERMAVLSGLSGIGVPVMTVPSYEEIMSGRLTISDVRPIAVEDLLKRDIVPPLKNLIETGLRGKSVLVTGAGGSIGSEICRQVLQYEPKRLVLLDHSEFAIYNIETALLKLRGELKSPIEIVPIIGSLLNEQLVRDTLARHAIDTVFHAAAYKHVPLLELNEVTGVGNNVLGTKILADACSDAGVARMTMISTDKAVRPTNVMGCSKRVAELYIQALARGPDSRTSFGIVRFGNVLDSSGSVVQRFRTQISAGGPITVTHEDITRFFMSIPEATQLVLQANSMAAKGEVFVLDMGEPVRITDLARTMIALSGMTEKTRERPDGDIEISYVGLRPGEKLHEELFIGEVVAETVHPQIKMAEERYLPIEDLHPYLRRLEIALDAHDAQAVRTVLAKIVELDFPASRPPVASGHPRIVLAN